MHKCSVKPNTIIMIYITVAKYTSKICRAKVHKVIEGLSVNIENEIEWYNMSHWQCVIFINFKPKNQNFLIIQQVHP